ncbi:MAG TPA: alpha/beta fold hydrolase [Thermoleophilaceae bacterium]|jgi:2-succinyl-6-hydroxy-2,4-cyclohexadiene-1-carboxylate synthase|nr:alpha/beta fold hydrolase [Thermoleophilaceae bacterium]
MVLFIPGFMQRGDAWRPVAELLPERYPSVLLDHRKHSFEGRLAEIAAAGEGRVLVGYSLGGRLALRAALRDPDRYAGVVTLGATAGIEEPTLRSARAEGDERLAAWMEVTPIEDIVGIWERQPLFADQPESLIEEQRAGRLAQQPAELALILRTAGQGVLEPVWHELIRLELPLLALAGARDEGYVSAAARIADAAPRGRHEVIEDAGHAAHLQRPDAVAAALERFLAGLGATSQPNARPPT